MEPSININQKEKTESKKSFENYQLKNTVDSQNKKVEFDKVTEKFPQFSLNINNPISWKLMLLIMLMQLLTNIMLVVVLYLKSGRTIMLRNFIDQIKSSPRFGEMNVTKNLQEILKERRFLFFTKRGPIEVVFNIKHYISGFLLNIYKLFISSIFFCFS